MIVAAFTRDPLPTPWGDAAAAGDDFSAQANTQGGAPAGAADAALHPWAPRWQWRRPRQLVGFVRASGDKALVRRRWLLLLPPVSCLFKVLYLLNLACVSVCSCHMYCAISVTLPARQIVLLLPNLFSLHVRPPPPNTSPCRSPLSMMCWCTQLCAGGGLAERLCVMQLLQCGARACMTSDW